MASRIAVVYRKELLDTLRDKRTLIAMLVIPIVLYPLLMMVVLQSLQLERGKMERQRFRVAVPDEAHRAWLADVLAHRPNDAAADPATATAASTGATKDLDSGDGVAVRARGRKSLQAHIDPSQFEIVIVPALRAGDSAAPAPANDAWNALIRDMLAQDQLNIAIRLAPPPNAVERPAPASAADDDGTRRSSVDDAPNRVVQLWFDAAEVQSNVAQGALVGILERHAQSVVRERLERRAISAAVLDPLAVELRSVATPQKLGGSLLGQIMPFLLVIMTVTGAIYPAIDLTAGERERGTLETLLAAPVPIRDILAGKFLVVVTITFVVTLLNLLSMGATVQFGGLGQALAQMMPGSGGVTSMPIKALPVVLMAMVPFAVLFSAVLLATCSFARTFKEAQNYMMPVMIAAMLPAMIVSYMPTLKLTPMLAVTPVANVVALVRELFLGKYDLAAIALVMGSTCLYAIAAVLLATKLYGQEGVLFTDVGSYRTMLSRKAMRPQLRPSVASAGILLALIFPLQYYFQSAVVGADAGDDMSTLAQRFRWAIVGCQLLCFALPVLALTWYLRLDARRTLSLHVPSAPHALGTLLIAAGIVPVVAWMGTMQTRLFPPSETAAAELARMQELLLSGPVWTTVLIFGILPGICEELLFRGYLQSGLRDRLKPAALCVVVGLLFGVFHIEFHKIPIVSILGILLAWVCWRGGSIFCAMLIHATNNGLALLAAKVEPLGVFLGFGASAGQPGPGWVLPVAAACVLGGIGVMYAAPRWRGPATEYQA